MRISKRDLVRIIRETLLVEEKFEFDIGLSSDPDAPRIFYREEGGKVDAFVQTPDGEVKHKLANASGKSALDAKNPKENERDILGSLRIALEDAKTPEAKAKITRAISRLRKEDDEEMTQKNMSDYLSDRHLSAAAKSVREKYKFIT